MKFRTTQKAIKANYKDIVSIGYCNAYYLLKYESPIAYTANQYGWASDIYDIDGVAISTGYSPFGNIKSNYELVKEFDDEAKIIVYDYDMFYEAKRKAVRKILNKFIKTALKIKWKDIQ